MFKQKMHRQQDLINEKEKNRKKEINKERKQTKKLLKEIII